LTCGRLAALSAFGLIAFRVSPQRALGVRVLERRILGFTLRPAPPRGSKARPVRFPRFSGAGLSSVEIDVSQFGGIESGNVKGYCQRHTSRESLGARVNLLYLHPNEGGALLRRAGCTRSRCACTRQQICQRIRAGGIVRPIGSAGLPSETAMEVFFLLVAIACILTAVLAAIGTLALSPAIEKIADRVIKGACIVALISLVLAALFLLWPH
jgi:hypothetical protein